ncbi:unnamed protein product [Closterium sp. Naga37s-1]|nr:unnamed protein product [Closterium sp. Naga37s-1]
MSNSSCLGAIKLMDGDGVDVDGADVDGADMDGADVDGADMDGVAQIAPLSCVPPTPFPCAPPSPAAAGSVGRREGEAAGGGGRALRAEWRREKGRARAGRSTPERWRRAKVMRAGRMGADGG